LRQRFFNSTELLECGLEALDNLGGELGGWGEVFGVFEGFVIATEDVEIGFVSGDDFVVRESLEAVSFLALCYFAGFIALYEATDTLCGI
jgi:hypothetical protein